MSNKKFIVWGSKLDTGHTHAFVHHAIYRAAISMGLDAYWLDNRDIVDPSFFDDSLIVTEQWLCFENPWSNKIPLRKSSTYIVHYLGTKPPSEENQNNPGFSMYQDKVKRVIDFRFASNWGIDGVPDKSYAYKFEPEKYNKISKASYFDKGADYDYFYSIWGTDILPDEIDMEARFTPYREPKYAFFGGTIGEWNMGEFEPFMRACKDNDVEFRHHCPWKNGGLSIEKIRDLVVNSYMAYDARPANHLANGYVPCRTIKNISYGKLGMTNSKAVHDYFDGDVAYSADPYELFEVTKQMEARPDIKDIILRQMNNVRDNHTYVSRVYDMLQAWEMSL